jgi:hypothetical protein
MARIHALLDNVSEAIKMYATTFLAFSFNLHYFSCSSLKAELNRTVSDSLHIAMADILAMDEQTYDSAIVHYQEALKYVLFFILFDFV